MSRTGVLAILAALLAFAPLLFGVGGGFTGTDDQAVAAVKAVAPTYTPWFKSVWQPASPEVESFLFALQAALGAGVVGYIFGFLHGRARRERAGSGAPDASG